MSGGVQAGVAAVTPAAVLDHLLDNILTDESRWCQKDVAQTRWHDTVSVDSRHADKFCMIGGIRRAAVELFGETLDELKHRVAFWDAVDGAGSAVAAALPEPWLEANGVPPEYWWRCGGRPAQAYIPAFNDDKTTTFEDVRLVLKEARGKVGE